MVDQDIIDLLHDAPAIVWLTDPDGQCTFLNQKWYALTGQSEEEARGTGWTQAVHEDDRQTSWEVFAGASAQREPFRFEYRLRNRAGDYVWAIDAGAPRFGRDGQFLGYVGTVIDIHEQKTYQARLAASEERYRNLFQSLDAGFCVIEMIFDAEQRPIDYRWIEINSRFEQQAGLKAVIGRTVREQVPDLDRSWYEIYGRVALTGEPTRFENHAPALERWYEVYAFQIDRPEQHRVALLFNDITERKEQELNSAFLAEISGLFARAVTPREILAGVGEQLCRHMRVKRLAFAEIHEDQRCGTVVHEESPPGYPTLIGTHQLCQFMSEDFLSELQAGKTVPIRDVDTDPFTKEFADGYRAFQIAAHIQGSYVSGGRWRFMLGIYSEKTRNWTQPEVDFIRDVSERVWLRLDRAKSEENLRESEQQARTFFEGSGVGAVQVGRDRRFKKVNDRFCQITGYSREELLRLTPIDLDHPEEREGDRPKLERLFTDPDYSYDVEKRYRRKDGRTIWVHVNSRAIRSQNGEPLYTAAVILDITARREAQEALRKSEQELRELSRSLEQRVAERTQELQEKAIRLRTMATELASAEHRERKRLAALLHDDLQQLLVAARMHLDNAGRRLHGEEERQIIGQAATWIAEATAAARALTHQLRPPALYEDGLVAALYGLSAEMEKRHNVTVLVKGGEASATVNDDIKAFLFESIRELLFNVAKHAGTKKALVTVTEERDGLRVVVKDEGKGLDPGHSNAPRPGSGYGLFSIRERLAALGGEMILDSIPGDGTEVTLHLPLAAELLKGPSPSHQHDGKDNASATPPRSGGDGKIRILVVDDHAIVRQGLATLLNDHPRLSVIGEAKDGAAALDEVERLKPDVVLMDINMPRMNGIEASRVIHRQWPETIVIGLSVQDDETTAKSMREAGASAFLSKAGNSEVMIATISELFASRPSLS